MTIKKATKDQIIELVKEIREERTGETAHKKDIKLEIEDVLLAYKELLLDGYDVPVDGIGTFKNKQSTARKGVNPKLLKELKEQGVPAEEAKLQAQIDIAASKSIGFKQSSVMKAELNA